jgi:hypothetical protein
MNIDGDYLWDRTGKPDAEIQELEEILGTLSYQPRPLEIPADLQKSPTRGLFATFAPRLAIAATLAMVLLGLGLWLSLHRSQQRPPAVAADTPATPASGNSPAAVELSSPNEDLKKTRPATLAAARQNDKAASRRRSGGPLLAANMNRSRHETRESLVRQQQIAAQELREAEAAKDELMLALRVASAKLSFAQRKTQNLNLGEPVHNQHKIG